VNVDDIVQMIWMYEAIRDRSWQLKFPGRVIEENSTETLQEAVHLHFR
jgi:hypothetical protein